MNTEFESSDDEPTWFWKPASPPFLSEETGALFDTCSACGVDVSGSMRIFKTYWKGEWIFECALCNGCEKALADGYSEESKEKLTEWQAKKSLPLELRGKLLDWSNCNHCGAFVSIAPQCIFQLTAWIEDGDVFAAYSLCDPCLMTAEECYSNESCGHRDRFLEKVISLPPGSPGISTPSQVEKAKRQLMPI